MMSDSFLYSGDDTAMLSMLQHCCVAVREHSGVSSESKVELSVGTSMALAPECSLTLTLSVPRGVLRSHGSIRHPWDLRSLRRSPQRRF